MEGARAGSGCGASGGAESERLGRLIDGSEVNVWWWLFLFAVLLVAWTQPDRLKRVLLGAPMLATFAFDVCHDVYLSWSACRRGTNVSAVHNSQRSTSGASRHSSRSEQARSASALCGGRFCSHRKKPRGIGQSASVRRRSGLSARQHGGICGIAMGGRGLDGRSPVQREQSVRRRLGDSVLVCSRHSSGLRD